MNKTKSILPLAVLLMAPTMTSCGGQEYQGVFNNDQVVCAYGTQVIDLTLDSHVRDKLAIKKDLTKEDFAMPEKYKSQKEITYAYAYSQSSFILVLESKDDGIPMTEESTSFNIEVKKSAFSTPSIGGNISVSLFRNEIKYNGYSSESIGDTSYEGINKVDVIGADFVDELKNKIIDFDQSGEPTTNGSSGLFKVNGNLTKGGQFGYFEAQDGNYIYLDAEFTKGSKLSITFNSGSTDLDGYKCAFVPKGAGGEDNNYFVKAN